MTPSYFKDTSRRNVLLSALRLGLGGVCFANDAAVSAEAAGTSSRVAKLAKPELARRLAEYAAALHYEDLSAEVVEAVKVHLLDTLGCGIGALQEEPVKICRKVVLDQRSRGGATVIGGHTRVSPDLASFANGAAARFYDLNDVYVGLQAGHPSDNILPALAVGETERVSGRRLIVAIALAYEVTCRFLDALDLKTFGWDHTVFSLPGAVLAAGSLMRMTVGQMTQAINLAMNDHIAMRQTRSQVLSDWKGMADAEAARNAVFATLLARAGLTGPAPIFEGLSGVFKQVTGPLVIDVDGFGRSGNAFRILDCSIKPYPAQVYTLTAIGAAISVAREAGGVDRIVSLEVETTRSGYVTAGEGSDKWSPSTKETADHSLPYVVARAMLDGDLSNASYLPIKLSDSKVQEVMQKIQVREDPRLTSMKTGDVPTRITATLVDGNQIVKQVDYLPGFAGHPMERSDVERKFAATVASRVGTAAIRGLPTKVWALERMPDVSALMRPLGAIR